MLIKIKSKEGLLHFEADGDVLSELIETFDELFISNNSITFNCEGTDCSIQTVSNELSCVFTKCSASTLFECDEAQIMIHPDDITVFGFRDGNCYIDVKLV